MLRKFTAAVVAGTLAFAPVANACTGITLTAKDGTVVRGRTLEFAKDIDSNVIVVPRKFERVGTTPDGKPGKTWSAKFASVGANFLGLPFIVDGLNEEGLSAGLFYFSGYAGYQPYTAAAASDAIAPWEVVSYILDNYSTVEEVRAGIKNVLVTPTVFEQWNIVVPLHYIVTDPTGASLAIEYVDGNLTVHDNPLGTYTNEPTFDWHMTNLNNYVNVVTTNMPPRTIGPVTLDGFSEGTGLLGLPGDFTPPSRFVRAALFSHRQYQADDANGTVFDLFHILNNFDVPRGTIRMKGTKDAAGNNPAIYTEWTSGNDLVNKIFYIRTYDNSTIRKIDLTKQDLDAKEVKVWELKGYETFHDLVDQQ